MSRHSFSCDECCPCDRTALGLVRRMDGLVPSRMSKATDDAQSLSSGRFSMDAWFLSIPALWGINEWWPVSSVGNFMKLL